VAPVWRRWLGHALPAIRGPRVLEVSFGTGWLFTQYAGHYRTDGIDLNPALIAVARRNRVLAGVRADLRQGTVEALPYPDATFDTVVNTMAFTGYPDAAAAAAELARLLKPGGRLVLIDINYPHDGNRLGTVLVERFWKPFGDLIRDVPALLSEAGLTSRTTRSARGAASTETWRPSLALPTAHHDARLGSRQRRNRAQRSRSTQPKRPHQPRLWSDATASTAAMSGSCPATARPGACHMGFKPWVTALGRHGYVEWSGASGCRASSTADPASLSRLWRTVALRSNSRRRSPGS
jgi:SAM-dependent methyltransferase